MRIRNAAIAGATAIAVAFGGTTIASAQETPETPAATEEGSAEAGSSEQETDKDSEGQAKGSAEGGSSEGEGSLSSKIGDSGLVNKGEDDNKNTQFNGRDLFGSSKDMDAVPSWAQAFYALSIVASIGSLIGLVVGPAANYIQFGQ